MRKWRRIFAVPAMVLILLSACDDNKIGSGGSGNNGNNQGNNNHHDVPNNNHGGGAGDIDHRLGKACGADDTCPGDLKCGKEKICVQMVKLGEECDNHVKLCDASLFCHEGKCVKPSGKWEKCWERQPCASKYLCIKERCEETVGVGEACNVDKPCDSRVAKCWDGFCRELLRDGDDCIGVEGEIFCERTQDGLHYICQDGKCRILARENEACSAKIRCMKPFGCDANGICRQAVGKGEECNDDNPCMSDLMCSEGKCKEAGSVGENCFGKDENCIYPFFCNSDDVCSDLRGKCSAENSRCEGDTYCCSDSEQCDASKLNRCISYTKEHSNSTYCKYLPVPGLFEPSIQCEWFPPPNAHKTSKFVEMPPLIGKFGNVGKIDTVAAFWSYGPTVFRLMDPVNCATLETIDKKIENGKEVPLRFRDRWHHHALATDTNHDGLSEIFAISNENQMVRMQWSDTTNRHEARVSRELVEDMLSAYELDANSKGPEIIDVNGKVLSSNISMKKIADGPGGYAYPPAVADFNNDGIYELVLNKSVSTWENRKWKVLLDYNFVDGCSKPYEVPYTANADFGTPGEDDFDYGVFDGIPEVIFSGCNALKLFAVIKKNNAVEVRKLMDVEGIEVGGAPTVGDFDNDGRPEIALGTRRFFAVYDPLCGKNSDEICLGTICEPGMPDSLCSMDEIDNRIRKPRKYVKWERVSQDAESGATASVAFDFDNDGADEALYADECFTRIYDGKTGEVLFSTKRSSVTSQEFPVVVSVDDEGSAAVIIGSDHRKNCSEFLEHVGEIVLNGGNRKDVGADLIHRGMRCETDQDCRHNMPCVDNLCRCEGHHQCYGKIWSAEQKQFIQEMHSICVPPQPGDPQPERKVCRAARNIDGNDISAGLVVLKDRSRRWVDARKLWTQHGFSLASSKDDGSTPLLASWAEKFKTVVSIGDRSVRPYNNYRKNIKSSFPVDAASDVTIRALKNACRENQGIAYINVSVCNRGTKNIPKGLPTSFYLSDEEGKVLNQFMAESAEPLPVGQCIEVRGSVYYVNTSSKQVIRVVANASLEQDRIVPECDYANNELTIAASACKSQ